MNRYNEAQEWSEAEELVEILAGNVGYQAFTTARQITARAEMLNFKFKNQTEIAFDYTHLYTAEYRPGDSSILLLFTDHKVRVQGLRLIHGYRHLMLRRVLQIAEATTPQAKLLMDDKEEPLVTEIIVTLRSSSVRASSNEGARETMTNTAEIE